MLYGLTAWRLDLEPRCCTICSGAKLSSSTSTWSEKCHAGKAWPRHLDMVLCPSMSYVVLDPCEIPQIISLPYLILHVYCPHARTSEPVSFCLFVFYQQVRVASFKTLRISKAIIRIEISSLIASVSKLKKKLGDKHYGRRKCGRPGQKVEAQFGFHMLYFQREPHRHFHHVLHIQFQILRWTSLLLKSLANPCKWLQMVLMDSYGSFNIFSWQNMAKPMISPSRIFQRGHMCEMASPWPCLPSMFTWALQALDSDYLGMSRNIRTWQGLFWADWKLGLGHWGSTHK